MKRERERELVAKRATLADELLDFGSRECVNSRFLCLRVRVWRARSRIASKRKKLSRRIFCSSHRTRMHGGHHHSTGSVRYSERDDGAAATAAVDDDSKY